MDDILQSNFKLLRALLISFISCFSFPSGAASLSDFTANFLDDIQFKPATESSIYCHPGTNRYRGKWPQADYLLNVADSNKVVLFVHGFVPTQYGGNKNLTDMVTSWERHIKILESANSGASYCVVTWNTEHGVDDPNGRLAHLITALRVTMKNKQLEKKNKQVLLVGHSAGGNYIKYSLNESRRYIASCCQKMLSDRNYFGNEPTFKVLTLATPHLGTEFATNARFYAGLGKVFVGLIFGDQASRELDFYIRKASTRGAAQLRPVSQNPHLRQINDTFTSWFNKRDIYAIGSTKDEWVNYSSASPRFATGYRLDVTHDDFLKPKRGSHFHNWLSKLYSGN